MHSPSISNHTSLLGFYVRQYFIKILAYFGEPSVFGHFYFDGNFHVSLRVDTNFNASLNLQDSCSRQYHFPPYFPFDFLPTRITHTNGPVFVVTIFEFVPNVFEISGTHQNHPLVG